MPSSRLSPATSSEGDPGSSAGGHSRSQSGVDTNLTPLEPHTVAVITLGCARNEVDSEELAGRLAAAGFELVTDPEQAQTVMVNTCGFIEAAKKDSVDTLLAASELKETGVTESVIAVGCMAERYGTELAEALPEADAVLGFDDYPDIAAKLTAILGGVPHQPHVPIDRRELLPITPIKRAEADVVSPGVRMERMVDVPGRPASGPQILRQRLDSGPMAPLKLASGCDRRCAFCAIPRFRGSFISRTPQDVIAEAQWLATQGVREVFLVSENTTSYGKDLGDIGLLEKLLPQLAAVEGIEWVRVSYLQPAETRPSLIQAIATTEHVVPYFDLSFQHAAEPVLRRMRRFGSSETFLELLAQVRAAAPDAGVRSNFIVGFPGETEAEFEELCQFVSEANLDAAGVFGYSDEDNTEAEGLTGKVEPETIQDRVQRLSSIALEVASQRASERIGSQTTMLIEKIDPMADVIEGRTPFQGPEVDGMITLEYHRVRTQGIDPQVGQLLQVDVIDTYGVDLIGAPAVPGLVR